MRRVLVSIAAAVVVLALAGCGGTKATVTGKVWLQRGVTYPRGSRLFVRLFDVTSNKMIAEKVEVLTAPEQSNSKVPIEFSLSVPAGDVVAADTYVVYGEVDDYKRVVAGTERMAVLTKNAPSEGLSLYVAPILAR